MPGRRFAFDQASHRGQPAAPQAKLVVGASGDRYEREADRIAQAVARGGSGRGVQGVQPFGGAPAGAEPGNAALHAQVQAAAAGGGHLVPVQVRAPVEHALGADFSGVRVHADARADRLSRSLRANALTAGQDIFFRRGTYAPGSRQGNALLAHELVHVLQQRGGPPRPAGAVQLKRPEDFPSYAKAKAENPYSQALLDRQKNDLLEAHVDKKFDKKQQEEIYKVNKGTTGQITSDSSKVKQVLERQDTKKTPHIDHRFPKSKGGKNSYKNAAVIPARANISKGSKTEKLDGEPATALEPYVKLKDPPNVEARKEFSQEQKERIYAANKAFYEMDSAGNPTENPDEYAIVSDGDGKTVLARFDSSQVPHVDHVTARSDGGTNYYFNAMVISAAENIEKGGTRGGEGAEKYYLWNELQLTLPQFFKYKKTGELPARLRPASDSKAETKAESKTEKEAVTGVKRGRSTSAPPPKRRRTVSKGTAGPPASGKRGRAASIGRAPTPKKKKKKKKGT